MNNKNINYLFEALCNKAKDIDHPVPAETDSGERDFNWLDAAPADEVPERADAVILACARFMAIRAAAMRDTAFNANGYSGYMPVDADLIPEDVLREAELHERFYLKLQSRLATLELMNSTNRHFQISSRFPRDKATGTPEEAKPVPGSLHEEYENRRRSNMPRNNSSIVRMSECYCRGFLDKATVAQLEESTDIIILATTARMAARASLRLEMAWSGGNIFYAGTPMKSAPVPVMIEERDRHVDYYLKIREELAAVTYRRGIASCEPTPNRTKRARQRLKKATNT